MLFKPSALEAFASQSPELKLLWDVVREMAATTRDALGEERLAWLRDLPQTQIRGAVALVHATPESLWRAPAPEARDAELESVYNVLGRPIVVYGHIHRHFIRRISRMMIANSGSAGLPYDGDRRAAYLLIDDGELSIRRVEYDVIREIQNLSDSGLPRADWLARILDSASPQLP